MPPEDEQAQPVKTLAEVVNDVGLYPEDAYRFVQQGLTFTVERVHGKKSEQGVCRHITGQDLAEGLRDFALTQYGMLARTVLSRWNITSTFDFGRIVFALVDSGYMQKTESDTIEDFRNVFDFRNAFDGSYKIECK
jgi:uncharacterized repeat protein (TIGR04138 family)